MAKPRMKLDVVIPDYPEAKSRDTDDNTTAKLSWRREVHKAIVEKADVREIQYLREAKLDVTIMLVMTEGQIARGHDLDNMTKEILDALQGKLGGAAKMEQRHLAIAPNDSQVRKLTIEKRQRGTRKEKSRLVVRRYREPV